MPRQSGQSGTATSSSRQSAGTSSAIYSLNYRRHGLRHAGILLKDHTSWKTDASPDLQSLLRTIVDYHGVFPSGSATAAELVDGGQPAWVATTGDVEVEIRYAKALHVNRIAAETIGSTEAEWLTVIQNACEVMFSRPGFKKVVNVLFNKQFLSSAATQSLTAPKPDITVGYQLDDLAPYEYPGGRFPPWSSANHDRLEAKQGVYLHSRVNANAEFSLMAYPFFCVEAKSNADPIFAAANQLANPLSYALGLLHELRRHAEYTSDPDHLAVFGLATSGADWVIYVAWKPSQGLHSMHMCPIWRGNVLEVVDAVQFLTVMDRITRWCSTTLRSKLESYLARIAES